MLVLQRVRDLVRQENWDESCCRRANKIEAMLRDVCKNELEDMSLEGFDARKRLEEIEGSRDQREAKDQSSESMLPDYCDAGGNGSMATASSCGRKQGHKQCNGNKNQPGASKQCANVQCKDPPKRLVHVPVQSLTGGHDWSQYWDKDLCIHCYARYRVHGTLETYPTTGKRGQDPATESVPDHCTTQCSDTQCSEPLKGSEELGISEDRGIHAEKASCAPQHHTEGKDRQGEDEACRQDQSPPSPGSRAGTSQESRHVKSSPIQQQTAGSSSQVSSLQQLSLCHFVRLPVEGLSGKNNISRVSTSGKFEVLFR
jgi:hypothetical protein